MSVNLCTTRYVCVCVFLPIKKSVQSQFDTKPTLTLNQLGNATNQSVDASGVTSPRTTHDPFAGGSDPFDASASATASTKSPAHQQANFSADWGNAFNKSDPFATFGADDNWAASATTTTTTTTANTNKKARAVAHQAAQQGFDTNNWANFNDNDGTCFWLLLFLGILRFISIQYQFN